MIKKKKKRYNKLFIYSYSENRQKWLYIITQILKKINTLDININTLDTFEKYFTLFDLSFSFIW